MQLIKDQIQMGRRKGVVSTQVTFDESYNLPDYLPDIFSVILTQKNTRLDEIRPGTGHVLVRGAVIFRVLYRTDQNEWKISSLEGEIPFQEKLVMDQMEEFDLVSVEAEPEDISIQITNSRKLNIRALLELRAADNERYDVDIPMGVEGDTVPEMQMSERNFLSFKYGGKESSHIREEVHIPSNKPNIGQILWQQAQVFGVERRVIAGQVTLQGDIQILLVYSGEEDQSLQWFVTKVPFQCVFEIPEADSNQISYITVNPQGLVCSQGNDEDGEPRMILVEAVLQADVHLYEEDTREILEDTYALDRKLILQREEVPVMELCMKNESKCRINETIKLQNPDGEMLQICAGFGHVEIDHREIVEDGILVEGAVRVQILYLTNQDSKPLEAMERLMPFQYTIEIPGILPEDQVELEESLELLSFLMKSSREVEVQAVVNLQTLVIHLKKAEMIRQVQEEALKIEELNTQPSIVGLTLTGEDSLWKIAKKYHTTMEKICQTNRLESDRITGGMKILLIKQLPGM